MSRLSAWRFSAVNVIVWALFCAIQLIRARLEEGKLAGALPEYAAFSRSRWWFL